MNKSPSNIIHYCKIKILLYFNKSMSNPKMFIFLHGYNSCGNAMKILDTTFQKIAPKNSVFLYPDAPFKVNNSDNYCWFQFVFGDDPFAINEEFVFQSMQQTMPYLSSFIQQNLAKYTNFSYKDIILVGFSQGAGLALHAAMHLPNPICGAISFSGGLANPNNEIDKPYINRCSLLLIHGTEDNVLPYQFSSRGAKMLKKSGFDVKLCLLKNTKHVITPEAINISEKFIDTICQ